MLPVTDVQHQIISLHFAIELIGTRLVFSRVLLIGTSRVRHAEVLVYVICWKFTSILTLVEAWHGMDLLAWVERAKNPPKNASKALPWSLLQL